MTGGHPHSHPHSPIAAGVAWAAAAALAFGVTAPIVAWAGRGTGPFATAALLYAGAAAAALALGALRKADAPVRRSDARRVVAVAIVGAALAPSLLAWGLQRTGATIGALLLNLEAVFTVGLAWLAYREPVGRRVAAAVAAMVAAGVALALDAARGDGSSAELLGIAAIAGATLAWAADNTLGRALAEREPLQVIACKGGIGAALTTALALAHGDACPAAGALAILLACGATGYGVSLRMYLLAQRRVGAARTASVFALAPFVGALVAVAAGDRVATGWTAAAAALFIVGVWLHVGESHGHVHEHPAEAHDHPHRHDDGHHDHTHDPPVTGEHAHAHTHVALAHTHDHAPDFHHSHSH